MMEKTIYCEHSSCETLVTEPFLHRLCNNGLLIYHNVYSSGAITVHVEHTDV